MLDENNDDTSNVQNDSAVTSGIPEPSIAAPNPSESLDDSITVDDSTAVDETPSLETTSTNIVEPAVVEETPSIVPPPTSSNEEQEPEPSDDNALTSIKQEALKQLSPLISHLDQEPEEKFKTLMMMIQASDDHSLIQEIHETAKRITDDKARAQALLDVVNEINYFTQHKQKPTI